MRITPRDIRQQTFTVRTLRGFDRDEVEAFLQHVAEDYESVLKESLLLREQLEVLEERTRGVADREKLLQDTLVTTQRLAEEMKENARREGALHVREAELQTEKVLEGGRTEMARLTSEIQVLQRTRRQLVAELRATLESYQRLITDFAADAGEESRGAP